MGVLDNNAGSKIKLEKGLNQQKFLPCQSLRKKYPLHYTTMVHNQNILFLFLLCLHHFQPVLHKSAEELLTLEIVELGITEFTQYSYSRHLNDSWLDCDEKWYDYWYFTLLWGNPVDSIC